jgi:hypothetical protein
MGIPFEKMCTFCCCAKLVMFLSVASEEKWGHLQLQENGTALARENLIHGRKKI